jgi:hypothetical protein
MPAAHDRIAFAQFLHVAWRAWLLLRKRGTLPARHRQDKCEFMSRYIGRDHRLRQRFSLLTRR